MMSRPAPRHAPRIPFALLLVAVLVGGLGVLLVVNTASAANEVRRHAHATRDDAVAAQVEHLRNEIARSKAPANLARVAAEVGMVPANTPAFLELGADGRVRVLGKPVPVTGVAVPPPASTPTPTQTAPGQTTRAHTTRVKSTRTTPTTTTPTTTTTTPTTTTPTTTLPGGAR